MQSCPAGSVNLVWTGKRDAYWTISHDNTAATLVQVTVSWNYNENLTTITYNDGVNTTLFSGSAAPPSLTQAASKTGTFTTATLYYSFNKNMGSGQYLVTATYAGCPPISATSSGPP